MKFSDLIIFENESLFVINKPAGLVVHSDGKTKETTLVDLILKEYPEMKDVGEPLALEYKGETIIIDRPGIVHRLDRDTSGVMLVAKNERAFTSLKRQFKKRSIHKMYNAFVWGNIREDRGRIYSPISRDANDFRKWHAGRGGRGESREAETLYRVIHRYKMDEDRFCYLELFPRTGRTHQIRVHMSYMHHPIVSDNLYGTGKNKALGFGRVALHARSIQFSDPVSGIEIKKEAPLPQDFQNALELAKPGILA